MTKTSKTTNTKGDAAGVTADPPAVQTVEPRAPARKRALKQAAVSTVEKPKTKIEAVVDLLRRPEGARIEDIMAATGWQKHSVRGAMSGAIKKGLGGLFGK